VRELETVAVAAEEGSEAAADADIRAHAGVGGEGGVHDVALLLGDHLEGELVMIAEEDAPLGGLRNIGGLAQDVDDGLRRFLADSHEDARHHREVESHLAFVAVAEVLDDLVGHLVGLGEEETTGVLFVEKLAHALDEFVRFRQVFAVRSFSLVQVGNGVEADTVHAEAEPEADHVEDGVLDVWVVVVEVRLVGEEAVPEVLLAHRVVGPVGLFGVDEDDACIRVRGGSVRPDVEIAVWAARVAAGLLEPRVRIGSVVDGEVGDDADAAFVGGVDKRNEVLDGAEFREDLAEIADIVTAVAQGRVVERREPQAVDTEPLQVVELFLDTLQRAGTSVVWVVESADEDLVEYGVLIPLGIGALPGLVAGGGGGGIVFAGVCLDEETLLVSRVHGPQQ